MWRVLDRQLQARGVHVLGGLGAGRGGGLLEEAGSNPRNSGDKGLGRPEWALSVPCHRRSFWIPLQVTSERI